MALALKDLESHTYGDYLNWPDDARYELIDGDAYLMSPAPYLPHQDVVGEIYFQTRQALQGKPCRAFIAPVDVRLPKAQEADESVDTVVQPDVLVVCDGNKLDKRGVRGAPDWVVEVLSPSTAGHDQIKKRLLYERHGVREYWLVHPVDRVLTIYSLADGEFGKPQIYQLEGETQVGILPEIVIRWDELAARLPKDY
ncbi:Uma2 family endonuclease [Methylomonas rosea]|uniref:Uma2 family endonuclease n=1 Tax=Methylomonas rosea TaxID=2952227 RepID=A0ABT1U004_9GAMM|nr:Uma2 family endonuclease [Methylomonas sp. WSC-7]MCQ8119688.1 Uma2 family endonuclease [Methylomonas sp. WSC-7]